MSVAGCVIVPMEDSFEQRARIAELLAETEALDWDLDWHPDAPADSPAGWLPDRRCRGGPARRCRSGRSGRAGCYRPGGYRSGGAAVADRADRRRSGRNGPTASDEARHLAALSDTVETHTEPGVGGRAAGVGVPVVDRRVGGRLPGLGRHHASPGSARRTCWSPTSPPPWRCCRRAGSRPVTCAPSCCTADASTMLDARARYEGIVLQRAALVSPGRLAKHAELTAARVGKVTFQDRHKKAREARCVRLTKDDDGMSQVILYLPTLLGAAIWDRITAQTKAIHQAATGNGGDPRTFDQIRADLASNCCSPGNPPGTRTPPTPPGSASAPRYPWSSPCCPCWASRGGRRAAGSGDAGRVRADRHGRRPGPGRRGPRTGSGSSPTRSPGWCSPWTPTGPRRNCSDSYTRDGRCRFPTCNRPPGRTEIDHTFDWDYGGKTRPDNLECLCKGEHLLKHHSAWKVRQVSPGVLEWTSPLGQNHRPARHRHPRRNRTLLTDSSRGPEKGKLDHRSISDLRNSNVAVPRV